MSRGRPPDLLINDFGAIYRISPSKFKQWLYDYVWHKEPSLYDYGAKCIGSIKWTITDLTEDEARGILKYEFHEEIDDIDE